MNNIRVELIRTEAPVDREAERLAKELEIEEGDVVGGGIVRKEARGLWREGVKFMTRYIKPDKRKGSRILEDIAGGVGKE